MREDPELDNSPKKLVIEESSLEALLGVVLDLDHTDSVIGPGLDHVAHR